MKRLTIESIQSQVPRRFMLGLMHFEYAENPSMLARALFNWLLVRVKIVDEFEEVLHGPNMLIEEMLRQGWTAGDCDDCAMLAAACLASVGALCRFKAIEPQSDGSYAHVFTEYKFPRDDEWKQFDLTIGYEKIDYIGEYVTVDIIS